CTWAAAAASRTETLRRFDPSTRDAPMAERLLHRFGHHYILVMMILTRIFGSVGGLLVIYYVELTLEMPAVVRTHFRVAAIVVVVIACTLTVLLALWETRNLRQVLRQLAAGEAIDAAQAALAGQEAVVFVGRHHRHEAWLVPASTLLPVLVFLKLVDDADVSILINITVAVFMGTAMALMSTYFAVEHAMQPVIRKLLDCGAEIDYESLPPGRLKFRFGLCSTLIIMTTALMIGTLARQRASDILHESDEAKKAQAVADLRNHSMYITVAAVITGVTFSAVLASSVASRARNLVHAMESVVRGRLSQRVRPTGNDEIDRLARQFNHMLDELERNDHTIRDLNQNLERKVRDRTHQLEVALKELRATQTQLTDMAHSAGMAEIATGVLHNVGNVLNSVNISASLVCDRLRSSRLDDLKRTTERLSGHRPDLAGFLAVEDRASKLLDYLATLNSKLDAERGDLVGELELLTQKIEHIKSVIAAQQNYARRVSYREELDAERIVNDVLAMHGPSLAKHHVEVHTDFRPVPRILLEKNKLVQVLDNLVKNAIESMRDHGGPQAVLTVGIAPAGDDHIRISVSDTGGGIAPDHLKQVFNYGFTTKREGNGFGLHSSALAMSDLGGTIKVASGGPGRGAAFTIEFPARAAEPAELRAAAAPGPAAVA
ncbi:MAG TPA: ATP-binding protein, partial [Planctomycetaceae bacterium]|nr:ATP-binding protein [Planctomycetaceae bacterium]